MDYVGYLNCFIFFFSDLIYIYILARHSPKVSKQGARGEVGGPAEKKTRLAVKFQVL